MRYRYYTFNIYIFIVFIHIYNPESIINNVIGVQLDNILSNETNKMILYLEILNSLIFDGDFCKYNKYNTYPGNQVL